MPTISHNEVVASVNFDVAVTPDWYGFTRYKFTSDESEASMLVHFDPDSKEFKIQGISGDRKHRGMGRELLRTSIIEAGKVKASKILATIVTRECLEAMIDIFGEDSVEVHRVGEYKKHGTAAHLKYETTSQ